MYIKDNLVIKINIITKETANPLKTLFLKTESGSITLSPDLALKRNS